MVLTTIITTQWKPPLPKQFCINDKSLKDVHSSGFLLDTDPGIRLDASSVNIIRYLFAEVLLSFHHQHNSANHFFPR